MGTAGSVNAMEIVQVRDDESPDQGRSNGCGEKMVVGREEVAQKGLGHLLEIREESEGDSGF